METVRSLVRLGAGRGVSTFERFSVPGVVPTALALVSEMSKGLGNVWTETCRARSCSQTCAPAGRACPLSEVGVGGQGRVRPRSHSGAGIRGSAPEPACRGPSQTVKVAGERAPAGERCADLLLSGVRAAQPSALVFLLSCMGPSGLRGPRVGTAGLLLPARFDH